MEQKLGEVKIDRSQLGQRWLNGFKGHLFALTLQVGDGTASRTTGVNDAGQLTWIFKSAPQAHKNFRFYAIGDWYDAPRGERILGATLYREDGKTWEAK
jgi:hypothetical protein